MRYPLKTSTKEFCDTIATSIARYDKYRSWASKSPRPKRMLAPPLNHLRGNSGIRALYQTIGIQTLAKDQERKSAQRGSFGPDVPADVPPKTSVSRSKSWKNKHCGTHIPCGRPWKSFGLKNFGQIFRSLKDFYKGPKIEIFLKIALARLKFSSEIVHARHPPNPFFVWRLLKVKIDIALARLKFSIKIENFKRDWFFFNLWALSKRFSGFLTWMPFLKGCCSWGDCCPIHILKNHGTLTKTKVTDTDTDLQLP